MIATTNWWQYPQNHYNLDGHIWEKCWMLHPEINLKYKKKDAKKKNIMATDSSNQVEVTYTWMRIFSIRQC